mgnify:CR=1 FL=1
MTSSKVKEIQWNTNHELLIKSWGEHALSLDWMHLKSSAMYRRKHKRFGIPVVALSALTGAVTFSESRSSQYYEIIKIGLGLCMLFVSILSALQNFLRFNESASAHKQSSVHYSKIHRQVTIELSHNRADRCDPKKFMILLANEFGKLEDISPAIPSKITKEYMIKFSDQGISKPAIANVLEDINIRGKDSSSSIDIASSYERPSSHNRKTHQRIHQRTSTGSSTGSFDPDLPVQSHRYISEDEDSLKLSSPMNPQLKRILNKKSQNYPLITKLPSSPMIIIDDYEQTSQIPSSELKVLQDEKILRRSSISIHQVDDEEEEEEISESDDSSSEESETLVDQIKETLIGCTSDIECTSWTPEDCIQGETIQRTCYDANACSDSVNVESKICGDTLLGLLANGKIIGEDGAFSFTKNLVGNAWATNTQNIRPQFWIIVSLLLMAIIAPIIIIRTNQKINVEYYLSDLHNQIDNSPVHIRVVVGVNKFGSNAKIIERIEIGSANENIENLLAKI